MSFDALLVHEVDILTADLVENEYGDEIKDWDDPTVTTTRGRMRQRGADEALGDREMALADWVLFLPPTVTASHLDRVAWEGDLYEVSGDPKPAYRRSADVHHYEVPLRRIEGTWPPYVSS